jgi:hypothetical protein
MGMNTEGDDRIDGVFQRMAAERERLAEETARLARVYEEGLRTLTDIADESPDEDDEREGDDPLSAIIVALEAHNIWHSMAVAQGVLAELKAKSFRIVQDGDEKSSP